MNRLNLLVASFVVAAISGCSFSVAHRGEDGCGENGCGLNHHSHNGCGESGVAQQGTCRKCGKKPRRIPPTHRLFAGDAYGHYSNNSDCGCGEAFSTAPSMFPAYETDVYLNSAPGCSTCGGGAGSVDAMFSGGMMSGGCGSEGGAINPQYLNPQPSYQGMSPVPATPHSTPAPAPPATGDTGAKPMPAPPTDAPMNDAVPEPFDAPKADEFGADPGSAPAAETPADPVSWQVPVLK